MERKKIIRKTGVLSLELTFISEGEIRALNKEYRGKNKPTDVISLSYFEDGMEEGFVGEIFICVPYAQTQAKELKSSLRDELEFLFTHGVLHIFGYDHQNTDEEAKMMNLALEILRRK